MKEYSIRRVIQGRSEDQPAPDEVGDAAEPQSEDSLSSQM
jgi:hypothetical protein